MTRIKIKLLNIIFLMVIYAFTISALLILGEMETSAASGVDVASPAPVEQPRPIAPQRDISTQRMAPVTIDDDLPPFWSR